jgi:hypothetical protein
MKKLISFIPGFFLLLVNSNSFSQVATNYTFSQSSGVYNQISGDSIVAISTHTSTDPLQLNDINFGPNHIPFNFKFNGINYSDFMINSNGFITFGATAPTVTNYGSIESSESYNGAVSAFGTDLIGLFGTTVNFTGSVFTLTNVANFKGVEIGRHITAATGIKAATYITSFDENAGTITLSKATDDIIVTGLAVQIAAGSIVRSTTGSAPNRVHTIQFKNFRQFLIIGTNDNFNFQIKLFETTGAIHVVYGNMDEITTSGVFGQVGLRGSVNTDFNNRTNSVSLDWGASTAGASNSSTSKLSSVMFPVSGTTYIWTPASANINITVIPEGFYNLSTLKLEMRDTVTAYIANSAFPFAKIDSSKAVIDSVTFTGAFNFRNISNGTYYIIVKHRNSMETWSSSGGENITNGSTVSYDFTSALSKAYGNNMALKGSKYCIYSGDVNQDGIIDATDVSSVENDAVNSANGYVNTDLTGDSFTDASDVSIVENNSSAGVILISP